MHFVYTFDRKKKIYREPVVRIHGYDVWDMDKTLSYIMVPLLERLQAEKIGAPFVSDDDVPDQLKSTSAPPKAKEYDTDEYWFDRWDYVLNEMIWAWKMIRDHDGADYSSYYARIPEGVTGIDDIPNMTEKEYASVDSQEKRINNGLLLFGKYLRGLWT